MSIDSTRIGAYNQAMQKLKPNELSLLHFLKNPRNWRAPSFRQMADHLGKNSSGGYINYTLKSLISKGYIDSNYKPLLHSEDNAS